VLRAIFGAFLGWAQALVAYGRCAQRRKSSESSGVRTTGDQKIRISRAKKAESVYLFLGKTSSRNKLSIDRSIDRSIEGGLFERAKMKKKKKNQDKPFLVVA
jgi:hypothetical protein